MSEQTDSAQRSQILEIPLSPADFEIIKKAAHAQGISVNNFLKQQVLDVIHENKTPVS